MSLEDVPEGTMKMGWVDGTEPVLVVNLAGDLHAVQGICSHEYFELDKGFITGDTITWPCTCRASTSSRATRSTRPPRIRCTSFPSSSRTAGS